MTTKNQMRAKQVAGGGIGIAVAIVVAWVAGESGYTMPEEVIAAVGGIIGWAASKLDGTPQ